MQVEESPALFLWKILASPATFVAAYLVFESNPASAILLIAFGVMNLTSLGFIYFSPFDWYDDVTESSSDWDDMTFGSSEDTKRSSIWMLVGLLLLLISSAIFGFFISGGELRFAFWVPHDIYPLSLEDAPLMGLLFSLLTTWFAVIPGEEGLKNCFMGINKAFPEMDLPFALQPGRLSGNGVWAVLHVVLGQNPYGFFFSVFVAGLLMDSIAAQSGTILNNYFIHGLFNTIVIVASFLFGGALTLVWS